MRLTLLIALLLSACSTEWRMTRAARREIEYQTSAQMDIDLITQSANRP